MRNKEIIPFLLILLEDHPYLHLLIGINTKLEEDLRILLLLEIVYKVRSSSYQPCLGLHYLQINILPEYLNEIRVASYLIGKLTSLTPVL